MKSPHLSYDKVYVTSSDEEDDAHSVSVLNHRKIFIDATEMEGITGISRKSFTNWMERGKLPYIALGKGRYVLRSVFKSWAYKSLNSKYHNKIDDIKVENIVESIMTVDPGKSGTGIAVWDKERWDMQCNTFHRVLYNEPYYNASFSFRGNNPLKEYYMLIDTFIKLFHVQLMVIEKPSYFSSAKGAVTASSGKLVTLAMICGAYHAVGTLNGISCDFIDVGKWKGQLTKEVIKYRIQQSSPNIMATNHDWDAIGIGLKLMGIINKDI